MLPALREDVERRRRIWPHLAGPVEGVLLDIETPVAEFHDIGRAAIELNYSDEDLGEIYWNEIVPAIAGSWDLHDFGSPGWLEERILDSSKMGYLMTKVLSPWWIWITHDIWRQIKSDVEIARRNKRQPKKEPFASLKLEDLRHDHK